MECRYCGKLIKKGTNFCPDCGARVGEEDKLTEEVINVEHETENSTLQSTNLNKQVENLVNKKNNKFGLAGFIVALCGLCFLSLTTSIVGLVFSVVGKNGFDAQTQKNKGFATAGLVLSIIAISIITIKKIFNLYFGIWDWIW